MPRFGEFYLLGCSCSRTHVLRIIDGQIVVTLEPVLPSGSNANALGAGATAPRHARSTKARRSGAGASKKKSGSPPIACKKGCGRGFTSNQGRAAHERFCKGGK
jgi:hypothetical protein